MPRLTLGRARLPAYSTCGYLGFGLSIVVLLVVSAVRGRGAGLVLGMVPAVAAAFFVAVKLVHIVVGRERIVFYQQALAASGATLVVARLGGASALFALDLIAVGLMVFLTSGRVGCFLVGCCHGRPARRGVRYGGDHVAAGFPAHLEGRPVVPVQLIESGLALVLAGVGTGLLIGDAPDGCALAILASTYGTARFGIERLRGDVRPLLVGLSEAQWSALAIQTALVLALPRPWVLAAATGQVLAAVALVARRRRAAQRRELAETMPALTGAGVSVATTPSGVRISASRDAAGVRFGLSCPARKLTEPEARTIAADLARELGGTVGVVEVGRTPGLFLVLVT